jgi:hypothetical protein
LEEARLFVFNGIRRILFEKVLRLAAGADEGSKGVRRGVRTGSRRTRGGRGNKGSIGSRGEEEAAFTARAGSG